MALLESLALGDHICWTVGDGDVRLDSLTALVEAGLGLGHRVLYCGDDGGEVFGAFERRGVAAGEAVAAGDLRVAPIGSSYLARGVFDHGAALGFLRREIDDARRSGYPGLRLISDMSWAGRPVPGAERLPGWEAQANMIFAEGYALGVCAYDPQAFAAARLRELARAHPGTAGADAPFDPDSILRMRRTGQPFGMRLEGEADLSNAPALSAVIDHLLDSPPGPDATVTINVDGLRFVDTAAARILLTAADRAAGRLRIAGRSPALGRILDVHGKRRTAAAR
ncbi:MEDS domain-containing protein [Actinoplanes sp. NPDC049316]|uniref:MEDS domain-containing protein n=1 Tax=Actinoplanes sp. NPDC049316 TaxID=3154727 RepID=UPI0034418811